MRRNRTGGIPAEGELPLAVPAYQEEQRFGKQLSTENDKALTKIDSRREELQMRLVKLARSKADYEDVAEEIYRLREQRQRALVENANRDELRKRMADMRAFLQEQADAVVEYDEKLVWRLIENVIIYEDRFAVVYN